MWKHSGDSDHPARGAPRGRCLGRHSSCSAVNHLQLPPISGESRRLTLALEGVRQYAMTKRRRDRGIGHVASATELPVDDKWQKNQHNRRDRALNIWLAEALSTSTTAKLENDF